MKSQSSRFSIGLSIYRIILSFILLKNAIFYFPMAEPLFGANAIVPYNIYKNLMNLYNLDFMIYPFEIPFASHFLLLLIIIFSSLFLLGVGGRVSGLILYFLVFTLNQRNNFLLDGSDNVIAVTLTFLLLSDCLSHFTYNYREKKKNKFQNKFLQSLWVSLNSFAIAGLLIQISFVYFFTALHKLQGSMWLNGTAVYYTMRVVDFKATSWNIFLTENHYFVVLSTYFTVFWELSFPFLVWFRKTKFFILSFGVLLHIGIFIFMRIDNFSWIMIGSYFFFIENSEYKSILKHFKSKKLIIFYDNYCPNCIRFKSIINRFDFFNNLQTIKVRAIEKSENQIYFSLNSQESLEKMASYDIQKNKYYYGFNSIYNIVKYVPSLYIFFPIMYILKLTHLGAYLYRELAIRRKIIPIVCNDNCDLINNKN
ncbi:DCC1-like thiol-disulfide oxidoreductase family protein [Belliella kenyensis]|uniref:DCC1-like thiol-disulfide oxidoreductase family protein n=1 Tax=Belliella kenyensis TaxID=1472724 RepID=A0ABV8ESK7_9BACT|nr:DCC1-like thiol-disulfide oxidoreductase family protein [Belliella kenyensis]MCH7402287.1 DCC1-like thiol-disulfide oxidoreductase family protein [Belliella kenyensis]MDN3601804.1 DCC1-like thiol-disulfide oxidoreductase family protein [Belliella kenyensis]